METKEFYKTSEFWSMVATNVGAIAAAATGVMPIQYTALINAVATGAYMISRGLAKQGVRLPVEGEGVIRY